MMLRMAKCAVQNEDADESAQLTIHDLLYFDVDVPDRECQRDAAHQRCEGPHKRNYVGRCDPKGSWLPSLLRARPCGLASSRTALRSLAVLTEIRANLRGVTGKVSHRRPPLV